MSNISKQFFWGIVTLMFITVLFSYFGSPNSKPQVLSLGELVTRVNQGEVSEIEIRGNKLEVTLKDGAKATSEKESEASLTETLKNYGVETQALTDVKVDVKSESGAAFWARMIIPSLLPLLIIGFIVWLMFRQAKGGVNQAFTFGQSKIKLSSGGDRTLFKDVAGLKEAKEELIEVVDFLKNPKKFNDLGAKIPRGVLLVGAPGTGKTLLARAVAGESEVPFFHVSASEFVEMFVGVGASRIRDAFTTAKKAAPAILFIDEIDAIGRQRGTGMGGGNDEREQTLNQILVELDGFEKETRLIVLAATNRPDVLDPALLRPGRFDRRVVLDLPDLNDREEILKIHAQDKVLEPEVDLRRLAQRTAGFSGADLANLMNEGAILAARQDKKAAGQLDLYNAVEKVILGPERKTRVVSQREKEIIAYHEGGHALVAASLKDSDKVHKVSIISRGMAGGYTMKLPTEDDRLHTKTYFLNEIAVMMGGYASEQQIFKDITTGASNDLKNASEVARRLVTKYGMSDLGPIVFGHEETSYLGRGSEDRNYSETLAAKIDDEVRKIIEHGHKVAKEILHSNKEALKAIADALLEKETLEHEEFYAVLKPFEIKPVTISA